MTPARNWLDLLLVAVAVGLTGYGVHGLLQRDTAPRVQRAAVAAPEVSRTEALAFRKAARSETRRVEASTRYLPPSGFDPDFRDPTAMDPDYALLLEELEAREDAEEEAAEFDAGTQFEPELSAVELEALADEELARELANYDAMIAELSASGAAR